MEAILWEDYSMHIIITVVPIVLYSSDSDSGIFNWQPNIDTNIQNIQYFSPLTFRDHLHFFVGQSLPSSSSTVCFQSCQLSVRI